MNTFNDYSGAVTREVFYYQFKVDSSKTTKAATTFFAITGLVMVIIAGIALSYTTLGPAAYFLASGDMILGLLLFGGSVVAHFNFNRDLQRLPLPKAKTVDDYRALLDLNEGHSYSHYIPDLIESESIIDSRQNASDFNRDNIYLFNGKPHELDETFEKRAQAITEKEDLTKQVVELAKRECDPCHFRGELERLNLSEEKTKGLLGVYFDCRAAAIEKNVPKSLLPYLNQSMFSYIMGILKGRYSNDDLGIQLSQRAFDRENPSASMSINVVQEGTKWYIHLRQLCQITAVNADAQALGYFTAELKIDPDGPGYLTWHSPQKKRQTFY